MFKDCERCLKEVGGFQRPWGVLVEGACRPQTKGQEPKGMGEEKGVRGDVRGGGLDYREEFIRDCS